jgi:hypothetical protein
MTHKGITLEFVVPTLLAVALAIVLSIGAVHMTTTLARSTRRKPITPPGSD